MPMALSVTRCDWSFVWLGMTECGSMKSVNGMSVRNCKLLRERDSM